jgi:hypothetical protein
VESCTGRLGMVMDNRAASGRVVGHSELSTNGLLGDQSGPGKHRIPRNAFRTKAGK